MAGHEVVENYATDGLTEAVVQRASALAAGQPLTPRHLASFDQFHLGGPAATGWVADVLGVGAGAAVLDVGCGIGGPARQLATTTGAHVTGIDLTPQHVDGAAALSRAVGVQASTTFVLGDATRLPFGAGAFDAAAMLFVGMNVADKPRLFGEVRRVLQPGGRFVVLDPVLTGEEQPDYPLPWAAAREHSRVARTEEYAAALAAAGFTVEQDRDCTTDVLQLSERSGGDQAGRAEIARLQYGEDGQVRFANLLSAVRGGVVAARLFVARAS